MGKYVLNENGNIVFFIGPFKLFKMEISIKARKVQNISEKILRTHQLPSKLCFHTKISTSSKIIIKGIISISVGMIFKMENVFNLFCNTC